MPSACQTCSQILWSGTSFIVELWVKARVFKAERVSHLLIRFHFVAAQRVYHVHGCLHPRQQLAHLPSWWQREGELRYLDSTVLQSSPAKSHIMRAEHHSTLLAAAWISVQPGSAGYYKEVQ